MRKTVVFILVLMLLLAVFSECRKKGKTSQTKEKAKAKKQKEKPSHHHHYLTPDQPQFWFNCLLATCTHPKYLVLALGGGFCSGMTVGLNSLSMLNL